MSNLLTPAEVEAIKLRRERLPIWEMAEDDDNHQIIIAPYAGSIGSTAEFVREARTDILRLLADREVLVGALRRVANHDPDKCEGINQGWDCVEYMREVAKSVLAQVEGRKT